MKRFLKINQTKLIFISGVVLLFSLCLFSSLYFLPFSNKPSVAVQTLAVFGLAFMTSLFLLLLIFFSGYRYYIKQQHLFKRKELSAILVKYHFEPCLVDVRNRWQMTHEGFAGQVNSFYVLLRGSRQSQEHIEVSIVGSEVPDGEIPDFSEGFVVGQLKAGTHLEKNLENLVKHTGTIVQALMRG